MSEWLTTGLSQDFASFVLRLSLGVFFILARFRYFYDPSKPVGQRWMNIDRHWSLRRKLSHCGWGCSACLPLFIAVVEVAAGAAVVIGFLTTISAAGLLVICIVGAMCTAKDKTMLQSPVDKVDCVSCFLWCPEPVYMIIALVLVLSGPGIWSVDALLAGMF